MKRKQWIACVLAVCLCGSLAGCGSGTAVYVQSVKDLAALGGIAPGDRFAGIVVSENVTEIQKDGDKTIEELKVKAGDDVKKGQELFSYDTEELQLTLDKQRLEKEQLEASIENYKTQIAELEKERGWASGTDKLQYTIQVQTLQVDLKEAELNLKAKEKEVTKSEDLLENATVTSPVNGRVQSVNESGTDRYGNPAAYITIQQAGAYRVKGTINELQRGGIVEGDRIRIQSRTDSSALWGGTVTLVDYENPSQGNENEMYYGMSSDEMSSSSKYPFYVELDSSEGLLLGQHLYLELETGEGETGLHVASAFVCFEEDGSAYVWAEQGGKLEKRPVTLGDYNDMNDTYAVLEGLTEEDYIAFPDEAVCRSGAKTTRSAPEPEETEGMEGGVE